jgi:polyadenylate-binding protein
VFVSLIPVYSRTQPDLAGKITGMLLEMDNAELIHLLDSPDAMTAKVNEALAVLHDFSKDGEVA